MHAPAAAAEHSHPGSKAVWPRAGVLLAGEDLVC